MTRTPVMVNELSPVWGRGGAAPAPRDLAPVRRPPPFTARPGRRTPWSDVAAAVALLVLWALLWTVFAAGVVEPGAGLAADAATHPSLDVAGVQSTSR